METVSRRRQRRVVLGELIILLWLSAGPGWAGLEEGIRAYQQEEYPAAVSAFVPLAQQGDARAQFLLGALYAQGHGVPQDYRMAAVWFRRAAEQGHVAAQFNLGVRYHEGRGVPHDPGQAATWFQRAAQQGFARAQYNLGVLYWQGEGVPQDAHQAAQWFHRAAAQAEPKAQYNLGLLYATGTGVPRDAGEAYAWFTLAAAHLPPGDAQQQAVHNRDLLAARLTPAQVQAAQDRVRTWQPRPEAATDDAPAAPHVGSAAAPLTASRIAQVQRRLTAAGFDPGPADGTLGPKTRAALRQYQRTKGIPATGELDAQTLAALHGR
jgi:TPR repeat protein